MKRKSGALLPLEQAILTAAAGLAVKDATSEFHGFQIARDIAAIGDQRQLTAYGTLYRALGRLEEMGLLHSRWEDPQIAAEAGRPLRRLYALTAAGMKAVPKRRPVPVKRRTPRRKVARA